MAIKKIIMHNIKGQDCEQELTGRDIFIGPNGAGKTTRLQSIGAALLGYVPGNGKKNDETFKLSTARDMTIGLETTKDFRFTRTFTRSESEVKKTGEKKIEISESILVVPGKGERTSNEKKQRIQDEVGNFPVMLDYNEFLSLSDGKRRDFFYNLSPIKIDSWNKSKVESYLKDKLLNDELKENNIDKYNAISECIKDALTSYPDKYDIQGGLTAMIDYVSSQLTFWKKEKVKSEGAVQKLAEIKNDMEETDRGIAANKTELTALHAKLNELTGQISKDTERKKAIERRNEDLKTVNDDIAATDPDKNTDDIADLQKQIDELKKQVIPAGDYAAKRAAYDEGLKEVKQRLKDLQEDIQTTKQIISKSDDTIKDLQTAIDQTQNQGHCVISPLVSCEKDFSKFKEYALSKIEECKVDVKKNHEDLKTFNSQYSEAEKEQSELERMKEETYAQENADTKANNDISTKVAALKNRIKAAEVFDKNKADKLKKLKDQKAKIEAQDLGVISDISMQEQLKNSTATSITTLTQKIEGQEKAKTTLMNLQSSMVDDKKATYNADGYKLISDSIGAKGIQGDIVKSILDPVRSDIQEKHDQLGIDQEFYFSTESDTGKEIFQFGWYDRNKGFYRNFDALSQGEQMLLLASLMITIIERSNPPLKLLSIDGMQEIDKENFAKFMLGLKTIATNMDNIIICGIGIVGLDLENMDDYEGFKIHDLGKKG